MSSKKDSLIEYQRKRHFTRTPEPTGHPEVIDTNSSRFVVHEHHATRLHHDFRLEMDGALKSWAIPKFVPTEPRIRRLAIQTEDHPLDYIDFQGVIPEGEYGAGKVEIWDRGIFDMESRQERKLVIRLKGRRLDGRYALIQTRERQWIILKSK
ncbi:MAG: DNA polymerase ligase N-terminal domain-containing protein [Candidatus Bathyarchaeia archaeon]